MPHVPVLQKEVIEYLNPKPSENFIDCTIGGGGHSIIIIEKILPGGKVLGIDADEESLRHLKFKIQNSKFKNNLITVCGNFADLRDIVKENRFGPVNGILFDLGMSSWHLEESGRGFSFKKVEPLDMRYDIGKGTTAEKIVNYWSKIEIEKIIQSYAEEKRAGRIAEKIIEARKLRPIRSARQLREIINKTGADPRKTFQALRIAVNDELGNLEKALPQAVEILEPGGRLAVISFHSLEDRIVKNFFKNQSFLILTKKPVIPGLREIRENPRSRSAKLRVIKK